MPSGYTAESHVCPKCVGDARSAFDDCPLVAKRVTCAFCGNVGPAVQLSDLADRVQSVYEKHVQIADQRPHFVGDSDKIEYRDGGQDPMQIMQQILGSDYDLAKALVEHLGASAWRDVANGGTDFYDMDSEKYEIRFSIVDTYRNNWLAFCHRIKYERRFFDDENFAFLGKLFKQVLSGELRGERPVVAELVRSELSGRYIYRGRVANTAADVESLMKNPIEELGMPPKGVAIQGRMNPPGISAFYGCLEPETCAPELRIPVGAMALVGKFELLRTIRVLDLRAFDQAYMQMTYFDPDIDDKQGYVWFARQFHEEIKKPVIPHAETLEYLPMQAVAEYLAGLDGPNIDGVVYSSSLTSDEGTNIVLFAKAASIEGVVLKQEGALEPYLRLDPLSIETYEVMGIKYETEDEPIGRLRAMQKPDY